MRARLREVVRGVVDRVLHVLARHLDRQADAVLGQLLDARFHAAIQAELWRVAVGGATTEV